MPRPRETLPQAGIVLQPHTLCLQGLVSYHIPWLFTPRTVLRWHQLRNCGMDVIYSGYINL